jgi:2,3-bisphosphoglycerate-dependent phosphoglycerate mutase
VIDRLSARHPAEHLVLSTHGNLMCLILQYFDKRINVDFWKALSISDVYVLSQENKEINIARLWQPKIGEDKKEKYAKSSHHIQ